MRAPASQIRLRSGSTRYSRVPLRPSVGRESRLRDIADENDLRLVVEGFYVRLTHEEHRIQTEDSVERAGEKWIAAMTRFWSTLLFGHHSYHEGSWSKDMHFAPSTLHSERLGELFQDVVDAHFAGPMTHELKAWAARLSEVFHST